jgi:hypothetical protein
LMRLTPGRGRHHNAWRWPVRTRLPLRPPLFYVYRQRVTPAHVSHKKKNMAVSMQASEFAAHVSKLIQDIGDSLGLKVGHLYAELLHSTFLEPLVHFRFLLTLVSDSRCWSCLWQCGLCTERLGKLASCNAVCMMRVWCRQLCQSDLAYKGRQPVGSSTHGGDTAAARFTGRDISAARGTVRPP